MPPDLDKLRQKLEFVRSSRARLAEIRERGREAFLADEILQAAAIRHLQVAIEAILDAANHIVAREELGLPKTYQDAVRLLVQADFLPREKAEAFASMVRFRNRAVHLYDDIDPAEVFTILSADLEDFDVFVQAVVRRYF